jgi:hypothetical protein
VPARADLPPKISTLYGFPRDWNFVHCGAIDSLALHGFAASFARPSPALTSDKSRGR